MIYKYVQYEHSLLDFWYPFLFCNWSFIKKKPQWNICWNPFQFKNNCHTKLEPKLYIYTPYIHSIQIMALQLPQLYKIYTSQRIFTSDMFWYGVRATCYPWYKFKHHTLSFSLFNPLSISLSLSSLFRISLSLITLPLKNHTPKKEALCLPDTICVHTLQVYSSTVYISTSLHQYIYALGHLLLQYMLSCLLIFLVSHICFGIMAHGYIRLQVHGIFSICMVIH